MTHSVGNMTHEEFQRRVVSGFRSLPVEVGLLVLRVGVLKEDPESVARELGLAPEKAREYLVMARAFLKNHLLENGEARS